MGVDITALIALAHLGKAKRVKGRSLMLGRHNTFFTATTLQDVCQRLGTPIEHDVARKIAGERFTEKLFLHLGAQTIDSMDASCYEGANILHDLNVPLADKKLLGQFDFIYDGGTAEHVYNVPVLQKNVADLLKNGGFYFGTHPANNEPGHGFYQFSPEFYFRSLEAVGMKVVALYLTTTQVPYQWYRVDDPTTTQGRITFLSAEPIYAFVIAEKMKKAAEGTIPMQSDYEQQRWLDGTDHATWDRSLKAKLGRAVIRIGRNRVLWSLNVVARLVLGVGCAVWPTSKGITKVDPYTDLPELLA